MVKYFVGENDDTLEVTIKKHLFMLNPQALLFAAIESGNLDDKTDGPYMARGGIRLNMCDKALDEFKRINKKQQKGNENDDTITLKFDLPDYISHENVTSFSYCFAKSDITKHDYAIAYFEFFTKDLTEKKPEADGSTKVGRMFNSSDDNSKKQNDDANATNNATGSNRNATTKTTAATKVAAQKAVVLHRQVVPITAILLGIKNQPQAVFFVMPIPQKATMMARSILKMNG